MSRTSVKAKKSIKKTVRKIAPRLVHAATSLKRIERQITDLSGSISQLQQQVNERDSRLDKLRSLANQVEPYQPTYHIAGIFNEEPRRGSIDRCRVVEKYLKDVVGMRMLDIGSSLGYVDYYFADRGAICEGWESNAMNAEVSRLVGDINGITVSIKTKQLDHETVKTIPADTFDVVFVLSVFHHVIRFNGLAYTQKLVKDMFDRVPVMIVELAKKGEDPKLAWDKSQPKNELDIFKLVKDDVEIVKLAEFNNHLSDNKRPLYVVSKKKVLSINNNNYAYDYVTNQAYPESPVPYMGIKRKYYFSPKRIIKEYSFDAKSRAENLNQIINEIKILNDINEGKLSLHNGLKMVDFNLGNDKATVVLERTKGDLASNLHKKLEAKVVVKVVRDILRSLVDLQAAGLNHNDIRTWNIIVNTSHEATLIDYGLVSYFQKEDDMVALVWVIAALLSGEVESKREKKTDLPPKQIFASDSSLKKLYDAVATGKRSASSMLELL